MNYAVSGAIESKVAKENDLRMTTNAGINVSYTRRSDPSKGSQDSMTL